MKSEFPREFPPLWDTLEPDEVTEIERWVKECAEAYERTRIYVGTSYYVSPEAVLRSYLFHAYAMGPRKVTR